MILHDTLGDELLGELFRSYIPISIIDFDYNYIGDDYFKSATIYQNDHYKLSLNELVSTGNRDHGIVLLMRAKSKFVWLYSVSNSDPNGPESMKKAISHYLQLISEFGPTSLFELMCKLKIMFRHDTTWIHYQTPIEHWLNDKTI